MENPQFKRGNIEIYNSSVSLHDLREVDMRSLVGLFFSRTLLLIGMILILLNNMNVFAPGTYFGKYSWVTASVFSIGICINYFCIPYLYFSSFKNFKKENDFWDKETFWILPLFFFGNYFLYGSQIDYAFYLLSLSIVVIAAIHLRFLIASAKVLADSCQQTLASHQQYSITLKYLTVYYMLLLAVMIILNPVQQMFVWIRIH